MNEKMILSDLEASVYDESVLGGKAKNLAWLTQNKLPVPEWFVITTKAFTDKENLELSPIIRKELQDRINKDSFYAVRSSAVGEDAALASFAGQMDSFLFQKGIDAVCDSVLKCFASAFSDRAISYRKQHGISLENIKIAVIIQRMIDGRVSGVFFTAHPVNGSRRHGLISSCFGIGEGIVSGICNTDEFTVDMYGSEIKSNINAKDCQIVFDKESGIGTKKVDVDSDKQKTSSLTDSELRRLIELGKIISERKQFPQDIEWTICGDDIYILQTRPITNLPQPISPIGDTIIWDNSNIQESYCGVTTPLTFTFASRAYAIVYEQTFLTLGISKKIVQEMTPVLRNLLGLIKGRVYYNINNWYRALLALPSFKTNKEDMERMMGLQDPVDFIENISWKAKIKKFPSLIRAFVKLISGFKKIDALVSEFRAMFKDEYDQIDRSRLHTLEMAELMQKLARLNLLMYKWQTPIINDIYVSTMNGRVHRWLKSAQVQNHVILQNNLMSGEEGIESTEPTKFLLRLCAEIRNKPDLLNLFAEIENHNLLNAIQICDSEFYQKCLEYIELYGDRCIGELKLESITLRQDPSFMFAVIKNFLKRPDLSINNLSEKEMKFRYEAEKEAFNAIETKFGKRKLIKFKSDLKKLRGAVKNRENLRLMRTRVFGLARDIYAEIGRQLAFYGLLEDKRDIFYLTVEELETYMEGRSIQSIFKPLVATRKAEYESYKSQELPHHFTTVGPVYHNNKYEYHSAKEISTTDNILKGIGCYPGKVEKTIKLIFSPEDELDLNGQILCTIRTDPGWAPLFPTAGGILVERGSTLSHSAVVARELGIPAIVNIPGLTKILHDRELVRMDGEKGTIERINMKK
ncbi:MAG: phosphoenolpyruvate synthase [Desulfobacterales bacterium]|nr:phosphoenolpyruvate synthase [Desulfobacterales bacterium]